MPKKIILFADGTWNKPEQKDRDRVSPSNVVKIARALDVYDADGLEQRRFYDRGVGTEGGLLIKLAGGMTGLGISQNIKDLYQFLINNYENEDKVYCFGFSRGAYTVRSLSGLIDKCGLLKKEFSNKIKKAYRLYKKRKLTADSQEIIEFKNKYCVLCKIHFLGVWDTVGSLGLPIPGLRLLTRPFYKFHNEKLSPVVQNAFQALAIDEQRKHFTPSIWKKEGVQSYQTIKQVWFPGAHTNIGGGYVDAGLSDIAFLWMKSKAEECGLKFSEDYINRKINPDSFGELRKSRKFFYRIFRKFERPILKEENANEFIHFCALDRLNEITITYSPENLREVINKGMISTTE
ncbi:MAG: DUF2235 domain-containing protein [Ignavibacteria bacterium]|nr:DUF2235 domain-containing protein [Ignavibacteria bacterium]MBT8391499.1 DUF2235 domain-containing protein [Ignavibacteria bacterium]NNJ54413.1 DUF2235 domain-containing protein [Ignavibacteriaceae bacterium]NNL20614.1 DUF2235 domain-containing protein [Ignavibacteriaceae bacterium]